MAVVAEGIETEAALQLVATLGCESGQGYFISRPLPADDLTGRLAAAFHIGPAVAGLAADVAGRSRR
jgi:EAL domain-containing protein (putative c-di-GMP-specific phosphodiesterase class I)